MLVRVGSHPDWSISDILSSLKLWALPCIPSRSRLPIAETTSAPSTLIQRPRSSKKNMTPSLPSLLTLTTITCTNPTPSFFHYLQTTAYSWLNKQPNHLASYAKVTPPWLTSLNLPTLAYFWIVFTPKFNNIYGKKSPPSWPPRDPSPIDYTPKNYFEMTSSGATKRYIARAKAFLLHLKPSARFHGITHKMGRMFKRKPKTAVGDVHTTVALPEVDRVVGPVNEGATSPAVEEESVKEVE